MTTLGRFSLLLALAVSGYALAMGFSGARSGREQRIRSAEGAMVAAFVALSAAALALWYAFLTRDFSLEYVATYSSRSLSTFYTLGAFWAGQPGSLLLWAWVLSIFGAVVIRQNRTTNRDLMPWVTTVLAAVLLCFMVLVVVFSNPFRSMDFVPADGQGLNPLLQNYGQWIHPVALYLGFVGLTIPFAFCIAALITGRLDTRWITTVRLWTLWAWILLTAGILFGARWAYVELGWGGYWGWDPVENASLIPWFTATAYLHSTMIQEKRGMLKVWNVSLVVASFALSIFGTFLTRSGVISSVHAFAESNIGPFLLAMVALTLVVSCALIVYRLPDLKSDGRLESPISREGSFLLNNLLLVGMAFAVFWGTVFPLVAAAVRGVKVSVGQPFFEAIVTPMGIALLALVGVCPLLAWRKASVGNLRRNFRLPAAGGVIAFAALAFLSHGQHLGGDLVLALAAFVGVTITLEFFRGVRARRRSAGEGVAVAFMKLFSRSARRYGGYVIHLGVVVLLAGIVLHVSYKEETRSAMQVGETAKVGEYTVTLENLEEREDPAKYSVIATFGVKDGGGRDLGDVRAEKSMYENQEQPTTEVGIRSTIISDLYIILAAVEPGERTASVALIINPGVFWIWTGALILLAGGVIVALPRRKAPARPPRKEGGDGSPPAELVRSSR